MLGVSGRVQHWGVRTRAMSEQVDPGDTEMVAQCLDVVDEMITAIGDRICRRRRLPGTAPY